jgi:hypothetical protein
MCRSFFPIPARRRISTGIQPRRTHCNGGSLEFVQARWWVWWGKKTSYCRGHPDPFVTLSLHGVPVARAQYRPVMIHINSEFSFCKNELAVSSHRQHIWCHICWHGSCFTLGSSDGCKREHPGGKQWLHSVVTVKYVGEELLTASPTSMALCWSAQRVRWKRRGKSANSARTVHHPALRESTKGLCPGMASPGFIPGHLYCDNESLRPPRTRATCSRTNRRSPRALPRRTDRRVRFLRSQKSSETPQSHDVLSRTLQFRCSTPR